MMRSIAVIPARSGSKGLPDKNILDLNGKPLLAYSVLAALESDVFDRVVVSTDSEEYARVARDWGAESFIRSPDFATDSASSWDAVSEVLDWCQGHGRTFDTVCLLQPTSPLRSSQDIAGAYRELEARGASSIVSVCEAEHSPLWSGTLPADLSLDSFLDRSRALLPRQVLPTHYRLNGAMYIIRVGERPLQEALFGPRSYAYVMPVERSVDVDTDVDLCLAGLLLEREDG